MMVMSAMVEFALVVVALANTVLGDVDQKHDWLVGAPQSPVSLTVSNGANVTSLTLGNGLVSASKLVACLCTACRCSISLHALIEVTPFAWYVACMYPSACLRSGNCVSNRFKHIYAGQTWPWSATSPIYAGQTRTRPLEAFHAGQTRP